ncbi:MAG TPA: flagellar basal body L-ring protein FlgH [Candidatus Angelobacter sp.]|nr:flagellar basal body L-ring protein FlgH [Candidatus Angelobacter sp.]
MTLRLPSWWLIPALLFAAVAGPAVSAEAKTKPTPEELRQNFIESVQGQTVPPVAARTLGSLWSPGAPLGNLAADVKARGLNDVITIMVALQTSAQANGNLNSQRTFAGTSAITGFFGQNTSHVNPMLAGNSSAQLKGQGQTEADSQLTTTLTGHVIAVLPNGNLVVEAQRQVYMNNQHETIVLRGVVQPTDITSSDTVLSTSLANLQIEMKGKGIISDSTRPPNPLTRAVMWLFGF